MYFISASAVSIIEIVLKIFLSNADDKDQKLDVMMLCYDEFIAIDFKVNLMPKYLLSQYIFV